MIGSPIPSIRERRELISALSAGAAPRLQLQRSGKLLVETGLCPAEILAIADGYGCDVAVGDELPLPTIEFTLQDGSGLLIASHWANGISEGTRRALDDARGARPADQRLAA